MQAFASGEEDGFLESIESDLRRSARGARRCLWLGMCLVVALCGIIIYIARGQVAPMILRAPQGRIGSTIGTADNFTTFSSTILNGTQHFHWSRACDNLVNATVKRMWLRQERIPPTDFNHWAILFDTGAHILRTELNRVGDDLSGKSPAIITCGLQDGDPTELIYAINNLGFRIGVVIASVVMFNGAPAFFALWWRQPSVHVLQISMGCGCCAFLFLLPAWLQLLLPLQWLWSFNVFGFEFPLAVSVLDLERPILPVNLGTHETVGYLKSKALQYLRVHSFYKLSSDNCQAYAQYLACDWSGCDTVPPVQDLSNGVGYWVFMRAAWMLLIIGLCVVVCLGVGILANIKKDKNREERREQFALVAPFLCFTAVVFGFVSLMFKAYILAACLIASVILMYSISDAISSSCNRRQAIRKEFHPMRAADDLKDDEGTRPERDEQNLLCCGSRLNNMKRCQPNMCSCARGNGKEKADAWA